MMNAIRKIRWLFVHLYDCAKRRHIQEKYLIYLFERKTSIHNSHGSKITYFIDGKRLFYLLFFVIEKFQKYLFLRQIVFLPVIKLRWLRFVPLISSGTDLQLINLFMKKEEKLRMELDICVWCVLWYGIAPYNNPHLRYTCLKWRLEYMDCVFPVYLYSVSVWTISNF